MEVFILAAEVVVPLLIYMIIGVITQKMAIFSQDNFRALNSMIFRIIIPASMFFSIYEADLEEAISPGIFLFCFVAILLVFILTWSIFTHAVKNQSDAATLIQGVYRSNFVLFGTAIAVPICGDGAMALIAALATLVAPMFNILAVVLFEIKRGNHVKVTGLLVNIMKNPMIDAVVVGCIFKFINIPIPELIQQPLKTFGNIATPLALVTLGGLLSWGSLVKHRKYLISVVTGRLVIVPALALFAAIIFGFRGKELAAVLAVFASPAAVASAPMAQTMGGNAELAGEIVAVTSVCCILTIFLFVLALSGLGYV